MKVGCRTAPSAHLSAVLVALVTAAQLFGCAAELSDGIYDCSDGGGCPSGWRCFSDGFCYSPSFAGFDLLDPCSVDEECASGLCVRAYDDTASTGRCSESCTSSASCTMVLNEDMECAPSVGCLEGCDSPDDCSDPTTQDCVVAPMTQGITVCVEFASADYAGRDACASNADCAAGMMCMRAPARSNTGICVWPCTPPSGPCPLDSVCQPMPTFITSVGNNPMHACLSPCTNVPNACGNPMLACGAFASAASHCAPMGWLD